jgi:ribosomal protein S18 acetylase RimI-like enzyme
MAEITIETATVEDVEEVRGLWVRLAAGQRDHGSHILPEANRERISESVARHAVGETLLVARDDDIVGFVMFTVETGTYEQDCTRGIVENLYVLPEHRNEGIGTALLGAAETALFDRGVDTISLDAMADNERARAFYRRRGYEPHRVELEKRAESDTHSKDRP